MSRLQPTDGGHRSQIEVREEGAGVIRRRITSPAAPAPPLEDDNLLREILLRLPPQPSSLHRASAVCKQWRCAATDPKFHRLFCQRHRKPPLLVIFEKYGNEYVFASVLDPPNHIPPESILGRYSSCYGSQVVGCRHGLVLIRDYVHREFVVLDPIISESRHVAFPPELEGNYVNAAVLCTAGDADQGHVHGACHSCPFKLVLVLLGNTSGYMASVYSSETGVWSGFVSTEAPSHTWDPIGNCPSTLVGNVLYWRARHHNGLDILAFDLDTHNLTVVKAPPGIVHEFQIIKAEDGAVGVAALSYGPHGIKHPTWRIHMWQRKIDCHGDATWLPHKTIQMHTILGLSPKIDGGVDILAYDEDNGVLLLEAKNNVYMVELMSMQSRKSNLNMLAQNLHLFTSFYVPAIPDGRNGAEMLHNT